MSQEDKENFGTFLCGYCGSETNGSQFHRTCLRYYDNEVDLTATGESLPTQEEENEMSAVQSDTPLSAKAILQSRKYAEEGDYYKLLKVVFNDTNKLCMVDNKEFYQYLSEYVNVEDLNIMIEKVGADIIYNRGPFKMRVPVMVKDHKLYHLDCGEKVKGTKKGVCTVEAESREMFINLLSESEEYFFCELCTKFLFADITYYSDSMMEIPEFYGICDKTYMSSYINDDNYIEVYCNHINVLFVIGEQGNSKRSLDEVEKDNNEDNITPQRKKQNIDN